MAVKQYSSENEPRSETLKYNITKVLEYIEELESSLDNHTDAILACKKIVIYLGLQ